MPFLRADGIHAFAEGIEMFGISAALTTPFNDSEVVDFRRLEKHIRRLGASGCRSFTLFGTTGEGPSVSAGMRFCCGSRSTPLRADPLDRNESFTTCSKPVSLVVNPKLQFDD